MFTYKILHVINQSPNIHRPFTDRTSFREFQGFPDLAWGCNFYLPILSICLWKCSAFTQNWSYRRQNALTHVSLCVQFTGIYRCVSQGMLLSPFINSHMRKCFILYHLIPSYTQIRSTEEISSSTAVHLILTWTCIVLLAFAAVVNHSDVRDWQELEDEQWAFKT